MKTQRPLEEAIVELEEATWVTAYDAVVGTSEQIQWRRSSAETARGWPVFDLASLTKPVTATLALLLEESGRMDLSTPIGEIWPESPGYLRAKELSSLLRHASGLPPWLPFYALCRDQSEGPAALFESCPDEGESGVYSDLGYLLWGWTVERDTGMKLQELLARFVQKPLAWQGHPSEAALPCALDSRREVELATELGLEIPLLPPPARGQVQDGNARFFGGIAGHAGLFGTAEDLWKLARAWLRPGSFIESRSVERAFAGGRSYALGWRRADSSNSGGPALSPSSFGHVGFTGGSLWVDPEIDLVAVCLAHRRDVSVDLKDWRQRFHAAAVAAIRGG